MKKTLKIALACAFGASLVFVGCTKDFSADINKLDSRVAALESVDAATRLASLEQNVASLQSALNTAEQAIGAANSKISTLESEVATIKNTYATTAAVEAKIKELEKIYATKTELQNLKTTLESALNTAKTELNNAITALGGRLDDAIEKLEKEKASKQELNDVKVALENADKAITKRINEEIVPAITAVEGRATALEARANALEDRATALETAVALIDERLVAAEGEIAKLLQETIPGINADIKDIQDRLGIAEDQIYALSERIQSITAAPCVGPDNCEVVVVNFSTIDTAVVKMNFKVTPAEAASVINPTLVVTSAQTRGAAAYGDTQYYAEYKPVTFDANPQTGFVTVIANISPIKADGLSYWVSLRHTLTDNAGEIDIMSDPVEAIVGEPVALTGENLAWFQDGKIVPTPKDAVETVYQVLGANGPQLFTKLDEKDFTTLKFGEPQLYNDVFKGFDIRVKAKVLANWYNGSKDEYITLATLQQITDAPAEAVAVTCDYAAKTVYEPAETWQEAVAGTVIDPKKTPDKTTMFGCNWVKPLDLDVAVAWLPAELYDEDSDPNLYVNKINAVGTSLKYTVGDDTSKDNKDGICIGGKAFPTLQATYRFRLARHEESTPLAVNINEPIKWDYVNFNKTCGNPGTPTPNAYFINKTWLGAVSELNLFDGVESTRIYKATDAKKAVVKDAWAKFDRIEKSQKIVDVQFNGVPYDKADTKYIAEWEETNYNENGVSYNAYLTQIPFTVKARHADVTLAYTPTAFVPSATKGGEVIIAKLLDDSFAVAQGGKFDPYWLGSIEKTEANVKDDFKTNVSLTATKVVINDNKGNKDSKKEYTKAKTPAAEQLGWFTLTPKLGEKSALGYPAAKLEYGYTYEVTFEGTIYDVKFTYTVTFTTKTPDYQLTTTAYVVNNNAPLEGQVINLGSTLAPYYIYDIQDAHFTKYLRVVNFDKATGENLTIDIALTEVTTKAGKVEAQNCTGAVVSENSYDKTQGVINDNVIAVWNRNIFTQGTAATVANYQGRQVKVVATLKDKGVTINSKEFTLTIQDPVKIDGGVQNVVRVSAEDKEINVLKNVEVTGILPSNYEYGETVDLLRQPVTIIPGVHWVTNSIESPSYGEYTTSLINRYYYQQINTIAAQEFKDMKVTLNGQPHSFSPEEAIMEGYVLTLRKDNCEGVLDIEIPLTVNTAYGKVIGTAKIHVVQGTETTEEEIQRIPEE